MGRYTSTIDRIEKLMAEELPRVFHYYMGETTDVTPDETVTWLHYALDCDAMNRFIWQSRRALDKAMMFCYAHGGVVRTRQGYTLYVDFPVDK